MLPECLSRDHFACTYMIHGYSLRSLVPSETNNVSKGGIFASWKSRVSLRLFFGLALREELSKYHRGVLRNSQRAAQREGACCLFRAVHTLDVNCFWLALQFTEER